MAPLRILFMGTAPLACESMRALAAAPGLRLVAAVTRVDQPKGRGLKLQASPVKELALKLGLPVLQPERAGDDAFVREVHRLEPELIAVTAYGQILPRNVLELPRYGCLNVHTSLLPKYRGAAPIQWAILNGEAETGVTIMKMDAGLDTGDVLAQEATAIERTDNAETLRDRLGRMGAVLLVKTIPEYVAGRIRPRPQPAEGVSHAPKIRKQDGLIDWSRPAEAIWNQVRALAPWPGAFTHLPDRPQPHLLKIWEAELTGTKGDPGRVLAADRDGVVVGCGAGSLRILALQREGGRRLTAAEFLAGHPLSLGTLIGGSS
jgi:methionyl-tRNA formyltransferase